MLKDIRKNPIKLTDCYNLSHEELKCNTDFEVSHMYNRADGMLLYGFKEIALGILSIKITEEMVEDAAVDAEELNLTFPKDLWMRVVTECRGYVPLEVQSVPEGTWCPKGTPFAQVRNTVEGFGEMVTWFEGVFMMAYFPSTCATRAFEMRNYLEEKKEQYGYDDSFLWRFHSFGFRGHKSLEDAYFAGTAWSTFLLGTDDFHIRQHMSEDTVMGSIAALAHKVTQQYDNEYDCFIRSIDYAAASGKNIVALVIDTYNAYRVIQEYVLKLAEYAKGKGVHIVFRPDSGDIFGQAMAIYTRVSTAGYKNVSVIIGEGMSFNNAKSMDKKFELMGVPLTFIAYGIGAGFYKDIERDTLGWAMKTGYSNGAPRMKVVKSDPFKQSIPGIVDLMYDEDDLMTVYIEKEDNAADSIYECIYRYDLDQNTTPSMKDLSYIPAQAIKDRAYNTTGYRVGEKIQERIIISNEIKELINVITKKYE
jgi:nicotinamide phosphoribosyltransferase